jgi:hypothetical protein
MRVPHGDKAAFSPCRPSSPDTGEFEIVIFAHFFVRCMNPDRRRGMGA